MLPRLFFCGSLRYNQGKNPLGEKTMKIAAFYENIAEGIERSGESLEEALSSLKKEGMDLLYLSPDSWKRDRKRLGPLLERLDIGIEGMHGFCDFPGSPETERWRELVDLAAEAGAGNLLIVPGFLSTGNSVRDLESMLQGLRKTVAYGRQRGMPILMEDYDGLLAPYNSMAGLQYFLDQVDGLECAFDTGNFVMYHEDELAAFDLFAGKIRTVHLKDRVQEAPCQGGYANTCADLKPAYTCPVGQGTIRMDTMLRKLEGIGYPGNVVIELYGYAPQAAVQGFRDSLRWLHSRGI